MASTSSSAEFTSLVTLRYHDFRVERLRLLWNLFNSAEQALASFWDPVLRCVFIGGVDLVPTVEEYTTLLQFLSSPTRVYVPVQQYRANRKLGNFLGLKYRAMRPKIRKVGTTWQHASISFDFLTSRFSRSQCPQDYTDDFINGSQGWEELRIKIYGASMPMFYAQLFQLWFCSHLHYFYELQTSFYFERSTIRQSKGIDLPFDYSKWHAWTHCHGLAGFLLPGVWNCVGYYPSLGLRQFGGLQHLPRIDGLNPVTFEYLGGTYMWESIKRAMHYWSFQLLEVDFVDLDLPSEEIATFDDYLSRILDLEQELDEVQEELDAEKAVMQESEPHYMVQQLQRQVTRHERERERTQLDVLTLEGRVFDLEGTIEFVQDLLQSSEAARDALGSSLTDTQARLEE
uniref:DUF7745 domain-containing protein n=1 Tax=Fagus sylvatica TaxID=28930 RepID=A0A2N9ECG0_FAGSY